jgi:hypothetical protein
MDWRDTAVGDFAERALTAILPTLILVLLVCYTRVMVAIFFAVAIYLFCEAGSDENKSGIRMILEMLLCIIFIFIFFANQIGPGLSYSVAFMFAVIFVVVLVIYVIYIIVRLFKKKEVDK